MALVSFILHLLVILLDAQFSLHAEFRVVSPGSRFPFCKALGPINFWLIKYAKELSALKEQMYFRYISRSIHYDVFYWSDVICLFVLLMFCVFWGATSSSHIQNTIGILFWSTRFLYKLTFYSFSFPCSGGLCLQHGLAKVCGL